MAANLLLADDSITIQRVISLSFADEDFEVTCVGNGELAIERIEHLRPDVVLADVFMPRKTGYEVCDHVKSSPSLSHIPVILLVGAFEPFDKAEAARVGADGHITKPFETTNLVCMVKDVLQQASTVASDALSPDTEAAFVDPPAPSILPRFSQHPEQPLSFPPPAAHFHPTAAESDDEGFLFPVPDLPRRPAAQLQDDDLLGVLRLIRIEQIAADQLSLEADLQQHTPVVTAPPPEFEPAITLDHPSAPTPSLSDASLHQPQPESLHLSPELQLSALALTPETVTRIARLVVQELSEKHIRDVVWEVVPELADLIIRQEVARLKNEGRLSP